MFHEMSDTDRANLSNEIREWMNHILRREGKAGFVKEGSSETLHSLSAVADELPPGTSHAFSRMALALQYLNAPMVAADHKIKDTYGTEYHRCRWNSYSVTRLTPGLWTIGTFGTSDHWRVTRTSRGDYYVGRRDQVPVLVDGDNWYSVFWTIWECDL